jgi:hypothetical protein
MIVRGRALIATSAFVAVWVTSRTLFALWPDPSVAQKRVEFARRSPRAPLSLLVPASLRRNVDDQPIVHHVFQIGLETQTRHAGRTTVAARVVAPPSFASRVTVTQALSKAGTTAEPLIRATPMYSDQYNQPASAAPRALALTSPIPTGRFESLRLSTWGLFRPGPARRALLNDGQLGGSQIGARLGLPLVAMSKSASIDASARAYAPIGTRRGKEAAIGLSLRKSGNPSFELLAERRIGLDREGRNAFSITAITGVSDLELEKGFALNAYAQAGVVGARARDGFVDGNVVVDRPLNSSKIRLGVGAWGGMQPGLARLDVGPQASISLPVERRSVRFSAQWRFRVAGHAAPASGPAIVIGADF